MSILMCRSDSEFEGPSVDWIGSDRDFHETLWIGLDSVE